MAWEWSDGELKDAPDEEMIAAAMVEMCKDCASEEDALHRMSTAVMIAMDWWKREKTHSSSDASGIGI